MRFADFAFDAWDRTMKVPFKKNTATVSVKRGFAWPFFLALMCPLVGIVSFLRRRLYRQAALTVVYVVAQTYLQRGDSVGSGLIDMFP